jgi:hypothetical protein
MPARRLTVNVPLPKECVYEFTNPNRIFNPGGFAVDNRAGGEGQEARCRPCSD